MSDQTIDQTKQPVTLGQLAGEIGVEKVVKMCKGWGWPEGEVRQQIAIEMGEIPGDVITVDENGKMVKD